MSKQLELNDLKGTLQPSVTIYLILAKLRLKRKERKATICVRAKISSFFRPSHLEIIVLPSLYFYVCQNVARLENYFIFKDRTLKLTV